MAHQSVSTRLEQRLAHSTWFPFALAIKYTRVLLEEYGLAQEGWYVESSNRTRAFGDCTYHLKRIRLSKRLFDAMEDKRGALDTARHEVAHALTFHYYGTMGHGTTWQKVAVEIGAKPIACSQKKIDNNRVHNYVICCSACGAAHYFDRMTRKKRAIVNNLRTTAVRCGGCKRSLTLTFHRLR